MEVWAHSNINILSLFRVVFHDMHDIYWPQDASGQTKNAHLAGNSFRRRFAICVR